MAEKRVIQAMSSNVGAFQIGFTSNGVEIIAEAPIWAFLKNGDLLTLKLKREVPYKNVDPWLKKAWFFPDVTILLEKIVLSGAGGPTIPHSMLSETKLKIEQYNGSALCLGNQETKEQKEFRRVSISLFGGSEAIFPGAKIDFLKVWCFQGSFVDDFFVVKEYKLNAEKKSKIFITATVDCVELEKNSLGYSQIYVRR